MGLSRGSVDVMTIALETHPRLLELQRYLKDKSPTFKCDPEPDAGLGYILAPLPAEVPLGATECR